MAFRQPIDKEIIKFNRQEYKSQKNRTSLTFGFVLMILHNYNMYNDRLFVIILSSLLFVFAIRAII